MLQYSASDVNGSAVHHIQDRRAKPVRMRSNAGKSGDNPSRAHH